MGRPKKPTVLKLLKGTARKDRLNKNEPKLPTGAPEMPEGLSPYAAKLWPELTRHLLAMGVLTKADGLALQALCETWGDLMAARLLLREQGSIYTTTTPDGNTMRRPHPAVAIVADADRRLSVWLGRFGLTPSERGKVSACFEPAENEFNEFFNK